MIQFSPNRSLPTLYMFQTIPLPPFTYPISPPYSADRETTFVSGPIYDRMSFFSRQFYQPLNGCSQNQIVQTSIQLTYQRLETDSAPPAV